MSAATPSEEPVSPEFIAACQEYLRLKEIYGERSAQATVAFDRLIAVSPPSFLAELMQKAVEMGILPVVPDAYGENGEPLYSLEDAAQRLGIDKEEALQFVKKNGVKPYTGQIHLTQ